MPSIETQVLAVYVKSRRSPCLKRGASDSCL